MRILRVDGAHLDGIHYLRTIGNSDALREEAARAERVVLIGGSFIGTELAASFTVLGKQSEIVMLEDVTHERMCGPDVGRFFQHTLTEHGVKVHGGQELERFEGDDRVRKVVTKSGLEIECDFVVIGAGVTPDIMLAERAGLKTATGVVVDRYLETSAPGVFAAGDIAEYDSVVHDRDLRIEHWDVAFNQGRYAALNMLGGRQEYDVVPYFWSDLADWCSMEYVGPASGWDEVWIRGSLDGGRVHGVLRAGGRLAGRAHGRPLRRPHRGRQASEGEDGHHRNACTDRGPRAASSHEFAAQFAILESASNPGMATQSSTHKPPEAHDPWVCLLRGHAVVRRTVATRLQASHGLTVNDYEALLLLSRAEGKSMRRVDLADALQLTASGVTRLLEGLEGQGLVEKAVCPTDGRVTYAVLTQAGAPDAREGLRRSRRRHPDRVRSALHAHRAGDAGRAARAALRPRGRVAKRPARIAPRGQAGGCGAEARGRYLTAQVMLYLTAQGTN